ncbi:MAG TPA: NUDIX hydrolase [Nitrososphaeria archaeon]|nr:NUDIX hydrolase [Conexivisphaerales archaeon]HEU16402.1 NUDIX hydrolase [Nitrososphaeria archaeon]
MELVRSERIFSGRIFSVRRDVLRTPNGEIVRDVVEHPGAVAFLPELPDGSVVLVEQYRHAIGGKLLEAPAGTLEPGESPEECAKRELVEETGYEPGDLEYLGEVFLAPGYSTERIRLYRVKVSVRGEPRPEPDEDITVITMPFEELLARASSGEIRDAKTVALALMVAARRGLLGQRSGANLKP